MGYAIIAGAINAGVLEGKNVIVGDPFRTKEKREKWLSLGATCLTKNEGNEFKKSYFFNHPFLKRLERSDNAAKIPPSFRQAANDERSKRRSRKYEIRSNRRFRRCWMQH